MSYEIRFTKGRRILLKARKFFPHEPVILFEDSADPDQAPPSEEKARRKFFRQERIIFIEEEKD